MVPNVSETFLEKTTQKGGGSDEPPSARLPLTDRTSDDQ